MVQPLRILVDVAQHAAKDLELGLYARVLRDLRQMLQGGQNDRDGAVLAFQNAD
jgi:hypothetical protein